VTGLSEKLQMPKLNRLIYLWNMMIKVVLYRDKDIVL